jgi:hypothetical protein
MRLLALLSLLVCQLPGQELAWQLPARGAAEYQRTTSAFTTTAPTRAGALAADAKTAAPTEFLPRLLPAPWLCQGELASDQRSVGDEPRDLRDVLRAIAFDLRLKGSTRLRYPRIVPFGDLVGSGRVEPAAATGAQTFDLEVVSADPEVRSGESKAALQRFIRPLCNRAATGTLHVTRHVDATAGLVRSYEAELVLVFADGKNSFRKLVVSDAWKLVSVHDNQDAEFRASVAKAIRDGAKWIKGQLQNTNRPYLKDKPDSQRSYGSGRLALALLTLLHADVPPDDPVVVGGFEELGRRELVDTYSLGIALMAMAARHAPPGEVEMLRSGALAAPKPRELPEADRAMAAGWLATLRKNLDTRVDAGYRLRFNYVAGPRFDNSVNQYGLLGLYSAQLCQLEVPSSVWRAAAAHLLEVQCDDNDRQLRLQLASYRDLANQTAAGGKNTRGGGALVPARGYAYTDPDRPAYGSMTTAGITGLVLARAGMASTGLGKADVMPKVNAAIQAGFAWLAAEFHVRSNPGYIDRADDNWYYYLYGLERTCELAGVAQLQGRDWYYEGSLQLMAHQARNGTFTAEHPSGLAIDATCFAVLFLKKATLPASTGG